MKAMSDQEWREKIQAAAQLYGREYLLRQLAEENIEAALAALKLIRAQHRETPVSEGKAMDDLIEEMADALNQIEAIYMLLTPKEQSMLRVIRKYKQRRMWNRIKRGRMGHGET